MQNYVAGLLFGDTRTKVMLIRKQHPPWMKDKLNGIGGKIEPKETSLNAMHREFHEETSTLYRFFWKQFAILTGVGPNNKRWTVDWYTASITNSRDYVPITPFNEVVIPAESVNWYEIENLTRGFHGNMMPNLLWFIYMAKARLEGIDLATRFMIEEHYSTE